MQGRRRWWRWASSRRTRRHGAALRRPATAATSSAAAPTTSMSRGQPNGRVTPATTCSRVSTTSPFKPSTRLRRSVGHAARSVHRPRHRVRARSPRPRIADPITSWPRRTPGRRVRAETVGRRTPRPRQRIDQPQTTDGPTNSRKSDGDAATWLPPKKSYRCVRVAADRRQDQISPLGDNRGEVGDATGPRDLRRDDHGIFDHVERGPARTTETERATETERTRTRTRTPTTTTDTPIRTPNRVVELPVGGGHPKMTVVSGATGRPRRQVPDSGGSVYYANCSAVRAAGDRIRSMRAQPGYSRALDRDGDGVV